ncbi:MAG: acetamidase/formamidase family protein [Candidatus Bathyarchaeia archaeon]
MAKKVVHVDEFVDIIGPACKMLGPVEDKGTIIVDASEPACWGPMITPEVPSGHTVTRPVAVEGAEVGDGIAIKVKKIKVLSKATASGTETGRAGSFVGDPYVAKKCPGCGTINPKTYQKGIGKDAIRCKKCDTPVSSFDVTCGYTMLFDETGKIGVTVPKNVAESIAKQAYEYAAMPPKALTYPVLVLAMSDMPGGVVARVRPMLGQVGTTPAVNMPCSHNAGDFGVFLVGAPHDYKLTDQTELLKRTDAHMDIDSVREGAIVIAPVKLDGGGVCIGDVHAMQGDGEIAGHTTDIVAEVTTEVEIIKNLGIDGPILLPNKEDLPPLAQLYTSDELKIAQGLAAKYGFELEANVAPLQIVGSGANLNEAAMNGLERMAKLVGMDLNEVRNRVTITGAVEIGRLPGIVQVTMLAPLKRLEEIGIAHLVRQQYFTS